MKFKESELKKYAEPLSETENSKCQHTIEAIGDALRELGYSKSHEGVRLLESGTLAYALSMHKQNTDEKVSIFIQGSYANNTCVRNESDIDIAIVREDIYEYAFSNTCYTSRDHKMDSIVLKNTVEKILKQKFPFQVHRANKSIKVNGNTYRKPADTVPCISLKYYYRSHLNDFSSNLEGVVIFADDGEVIANFPKQHIANGKKKNNDTNYYYKKMVRIIKKMRYIMSDLGYKCADSVSSFGVESLLWNIPDYYFTRYSIYGFAFSEIVRYAYLHKNDLINYYEANGIKKLCPTAQDVSNYSNFIDQLFLFFEYDYNS